MLRAMRRNTTKGVTAIDRRYLRSLKSYEPLTERDLAEQVIEFANSGSVRAFALLCAGVALSDSVLTNIAKRLEARSRAVREREQRAVREALGLIVAGRVTAPMRDLWLRHEEGLAMIPTMGPRDFLPPWRDDPRRFRYVAIERFTKPPLPPIAFVLVGLLAKSSDLCRCNSRECERFFFAMRPQTDSKGGKRGRDVRLYCTPEHRRAAEKEQAKERSRRYRVNRAGKQADAKHPKRRR